MDIDLIKTATIYEKNGNRCNIYQHIMDKNEYHIDTEDDWKKAENIINNNIKLFNII